MHRSTTLENGVRVVTRAIPGSRSVALGVLADAGPRDEPADKAGLAHLTEHLMFAGTSSRDALDVARLMDTLGGHLGGFTTRDYTCYAATVPDEYVPYALDLFGDLLLNSTYPGGAVAAQKAVIASELAAADDQPDRVVNDRLKRLAWPSHPLGRPVGGHPHTVAALTREDVIYFAHGHYLPDRLIVAAAGNVEHDEFVAQARDGFWRLIGGRGPRELSAPEYCPGVDLVTRPFAQGYFALAVPAPAYAAADRLAWHVLATALGGGISSRLFRSAREQRGLAFHVAAEYQAYADAGLLVVEGGAAPDDLADVVELAHAELAALADGSAPVDDDELWRVKMQLRGQHLLGSQDAGTQFARCATQELYFGRGVPDEELLAGIAAVDPSALARAADALAAALRTPALVVAGPDEVARHAARLHDTVALSPSGDARWPSTPA